MCIKDYETEKGGQGPVRAVELLGKKIRHRQSPLVDLKWFLERESVRVETGFS
jgi:hypothetical protein